MMRRRIFAAAVSVAILFSGIAFPGGALLCREGNGRVSLEPFHAPHAFSCTQDEGHSGRPEDVSIAHRHERCTDTEASGIQAPAQAMKFRPAMELGAVAFDMPARPAFGPTNDACRPSSSPHSTSPPTILRV
jgi:hypothetical protein